MLTESFPLLPKQADISAQSSNVCRERTLTMNRKQFDGFSMIELMVAMAVGFVIITGVFSLNSVTRETQRTSEAQMDMVADARFAIEMIAYDLRHAGMWGGTNKDSVIECRADDTVCAAGSDALAAATNDCVAAGNWYHDLSLPVFATNNSNPYSATCIPTATEKYQANTDVLEIRYADSNTGAALKSGQVYVRSNFVNGKAFIGTSQPLLPAYDTGPLDPITKDYPLRAYAYYVSSYTDSIGDGIPSLRRVALVEGPAVQNQTLVSGVVDLQVQFGEDAIGGDQVVDRYVNPQDVKDWKNVYAAKIWLLMRTDAKQKVVKKKTFTIAGNATEYGADGFRYFMVSSVIDLRNLRPL